MIVDDNPKWVKCYIEDLWGVRFKKCSDEAVLPWKPYHFKDPKGVLYIAMTRGVKCHEQGGSYTIQEYDIYRQEGLFKVEVKNLKDVTVGVLLNEES